MVCIICHNNKSSYVRYPCNNELCKTMLCTDCYDTYTSYPNLCYKCPICKRTGIFTYKERIKYRFRHSNCYKLLRDLYYLLLLMTIAICFLLLIGNLIIYVR